MMGSSVRREVSLRIGDMDDAIGLKDSLTGPQVDVAPWNDGARSEGSRGRPRQHRENPSMLSGIHPVKSKRRRSGDSIRSTFAATPKRLGNGAAKYGYYQG